MVGEASGDVADTYTELNFLSRDGRRIPVFVFTSATAAKTGRYAVFLGGGPRELLYRSNPVIDALVARGLTVLSPVYQGIASTNAPGDDMALALRDIEAFTTGSSPQASLIVGYSAGGYLASAVRTASPTMPRVLVAPLMTSPAEGWKTLLAALKTSGLTPDASPLCIKRSDGHGEHCGPRSVFLNSFWGDYWKKSPAALLRRSAAPGSVTAVVSRADRRAFSSLGADEFRKAGARLVFGDFTHERAVDDPDTVAAVLTAAR